MGTIIYRNSGKRRNATLVNNSASSVEFSTPMGRRITVAAGYKCLWWPAVMTIAFAATRDHAIQRHRECYGNLPPCRRCHLLPSPRGLSHVHCPVHWPRAATYRDPVPRFVLAQFVIGKRFEREDFASINI